MSEATDIAARLAAIESKIVAACARAGRSRDEVQLIGVSKRKSAEAIILAVRAGLAHVGENYVQEALAKLPQVKSALGATPCPRFHFIGQLQRNKVRQVVPLFDQVQTLDRASLGIELNRRAEAAGRTIDALIQIDLSDEPQKGGIPSQDLPALLEASQDWAAVTIRGLMAIPAAGEPAESMRPAFKALRELRDASQSLPGGANLYDLSMGMSADYEVAIEEGATIIRVGTALFGARDPGESA